MSRTFRKKRVRLHRDDNGHFYKETVIYDKARDDKDVTQPTFPPHKMPSYTTKRQWKFPVELGHATGVTKLGKLVARNANRSLKKAVRQNSKKLIKAEIDVTKFDW